MVSREEVGAAVGRWGSCAVAEDHLAAVFQYGVQDLVVEAVAGEGCGGGDRWETGFGDELVEEVRRTGHGRIVSEVGLGA
ncbi:hypothetical protein GCM10009741_33150 [Kribbella lupini]|uniref:Uncharacterized protein n=1 Tax=Kribbella lupini TaxID=291602 RepID=A0ABP4LRP4_9ACTN